jgi:hypothetical protein
VAISIILFNLSAPSSFSLPIAFSFAMVFFN